MNRRLGLLLLLGMASHAATGGTVAGISAGETLSAGMVRTIVLPDHVVPEPGKNEMELVLSLDDGVSFPLRVSSEVPVDTTWLVFRVPNLPTATARIGLRVGHDGREEQIRSVSETFSIAPSPDAPLEVLRAVRGEPATRDVRGAAAWPPVPEGLSEEGPDRLEALGDDGGIDDDSAPASIPSDFRSTSLSPGTLFADGMVPRSSRSRAPLQTPQRE